ncbi:MAG: hypothetical protein KBD21_05265 [Candidatus Pacebacteria bacterium]|nr:hypothetical protein [Candidatus Paceibacterota bacterium]
MKKPEPKSLVDTNVEEGTHAAFTRSRKHLLRLSLESIALTFACLAVVGTKLFYPFHMVIGIGLYILSFIPIVWRLYLGRKTWKKYRAYTFTETFFKKEKKRLVFGTLLVCGVAIFLYARPLDARPFAHLADEEVRVLIQDDLYRGVQAMDYLESSGNVLLSVLAEQDEDVNRAERIDQAFNEFLQAVIFSESLTETHRYFASMPYRLWHERILSFLLSYSLYVKKYELVHRIMNDVADSAFEKKVLNQFAPSVGHNGVYNEMVVRYYAPKTRVRLIGGYLYKRMFVHIPQGDACSECLLSKKADQSATYLRTHTVTTMLRSGGVVADHVEHEMFEQWFPVQKGAATAMGRAILTSRGKDGLIASDQIDVMEESMLPGDIMLQRRNWHVSNVGIPGFWTHSAIYTGDLATMEAYFASEFPYGEYDTFSAYFAERYPDVYAKYNTPDTQKGPLSVIEAIEQGVVLQSMSVSADADHVVVLRPLRTKRDVFLALEKAFAHVGKPYDFNFDFDTRDALVCSELVYDAYFPRPPEKAGLTFGTSLVNGRKIVSPMDMAHKYVDERESQEAELSFVYFLRGNEDLGVARVATEEEFLESITWSKFSFFQ